VMIWALTCDIVESTFTVKRATARPACFFAGHCLDRARCAPCFAAQVGNRYFWRR
jgi:hypothetical protein